MRKYLFTLIIFNLCLINSAYSDGIIFSQYKNQYIVGSVEFTDNNIKTLNDGILFFSDDNLELRLKQNTIIEKLSDKNSKNYKYNLEVGNLGAKVGSESILIKTPFADIKTSDSIVILNVTRFMTRLCVLKGSAVFKKNNELVSVKQGNEIAASKFNLSSPYKFLDDLRYVWYWTTPDKEPSLN